MKATISVYLAAAGAVWVTGAWPVRGVAAERGAPVLRPFALMGNPPPVQMTVPGFVVRELPVQLTNINNLAYGPDQRLYAYAFDGKVYRLEDTDGDGLEDKASVFYANERGVIGTVGMRWGADGLYLASRYQVMRLTDRGDGVAKVDVVASGWAPPDALAAGSRYMDVYGLAIAPDGTVFFGLGISDIRNAYRLDPETKKSRYARTWDRGTVQRVGRSGAREIFATGLRFTVSLAFNAAGDLFATDQEGATWLYNGNPFDELLHVEAGRHYGFPPRHPEHLQDVIDEPSVFDYGPQHQAVCSVNFNEPAKAGARIFGPEWWRGDAIVTGSARGRIYRTSVVKTAAGYVARNETIAHLSMLTVEAIVAPTGELLVSCHSGRPDWGTGPTGMGRLYKIAYRGREAAQPVLAYAASPTEVRVVFDRAIGGGDFSALAEHTMMTMGEYVSSGDRFESIRPGYQAVKDQQKAPRYALPVLAGEIDRARNAVVLRTVERREAVNYSIALREGAGGARKHDESRRELAQQAAVDVGFDLSGVEVVWRDARGTEKWRGWLPSLDLEIARGLTRASVEHRRLFEHLKERGTLEAAVQLNLHSMLRPLVQPGAKLDYTLPAESVRVGLHGRVLEVQSAGRAKVQRRGDGEWEVAVDDVTEEWVPVVVRVATGDGAPRLDVTWTTAEDERPRALALHRMLLPWARRQKVNTQGDAPAERPELAGGDWTRGRELFFGKATCSLCHAVNGRGADLGPDLTNLVHRDYASVVADIVEPSAALNPDYLAVTMQLKNGGMVGGVMLQNFDGKYVLGQPNGEKKTVARDEVEPGTTKSAGVSLMPPGLLEALSDMERKDLLTFLLTAAPTRR